MPRPAGPFKHITSVRHRALGVREFTTLEKDPRFHQFPNHDIRHKLFPANPPHLASLDETLKRETVKVYDNPHYGLTMYSPPLDLAEFVRHEAVRDEIPGVRDISLKEIREEVEVEEILDLNYEIFFPVPSDDLVSSKSTLDFSSLRKQGSSRRFAAAYMHPEIAAALARFGKMPDKTLAVLSRCVFWMEKPSKSFVEKMVKKTLRAMKRTVIFVTAWFNFHKESASHSSTPAKTTKKNLYRSILDTLSASQYTQQDQLHSQQKDNIQTLFTEALSSVELPGGASATLHSFNKKSSTPSGPLNLSTLCPLANTSLPIIVFSHGICGSSEVYSSICRSLASFGFIVICPTFTDGTAPAALSYSQTAAFASQPISKLHSLPKSVLTDSMQVVYGIPEIDSIPEKPIVPFFAMPAADSASFRDRSIHNTQLCRRSRELMFAMDITKLASENHWNPFAVVSPPENVRPLRATFPSDSQFQERIPKDKCFLYQIMPSLLVFQQGIVSHTSEATKHFTRSPFFASSETKKEAKNVTITPQSALFIQTPGVKGKAAKHLKQMIVSVPRRGLSCIAGPVPYHFDWERVGISGHSFGGATAYSISLQQAQQTTEKPFFKAAITLDPWLYPLSTLIPYKNNPINIPLLSFCTETWLLWGDHDIMVRAMNSLFATKPSADADADETKTHKAEYRDDVVLAYVRGTIHTDFSDVVHWSPRLLRMLDKAGPLNSELSHQLSSKFCGNFALKYIANAGEEDNSERICVDERIQLASEKAMKELLLNENVVEAIPVDVFPNKYEYLKGGKPFEVLNIQYIQ